MNGQSPQQEASSSATAGQGPGEGSVEGISVDRRGFFRRILLRGMEQAAAGASRVAQEAQKAFERGEAGVPGGPGVGKVEPPAWTVGRGERGG
ncbi:MAG: hypothetical protein IT442_05940 [Phycisphaeraceae bacterium]|nr:hypothetical protein [Phycisphaeraceae bacterium]